MNIFVTKLNFKTTASALQKLFEKYGKVSSAKIINDKVTQKSRGFGFVEMPDNKEAMEAINALDGATFDGREIVVKESDR